MWNLTQMKKNYRYYRDICCKFCKMCVKLKPFSAKIRISILLNNLRDYLILALMC